MLVEVEYWGGVSGIFLFHRFLVVEYGIGGGLFLLSSRSTLGNGMRRLACFGDWD